MAFSTQNDFVSLPYAELPPVELKSETKLKTYESCIDIRAWSLDKAKNSKYLVDMVQKIQNDPGLELGGGDANLRLTKKQLESMTRDELIRHVLGLYEKIENECAELTKEVSSKVESGAQTSTDEENKDMRLTVKETTRVVADSCHFTKLLFYQQSVVQLVAHIKTIEQAFKLLKQRARIVDPLVQENIKLFRVCHRLR